MNVAADARCFHCGQPRHPGNPAQNISVPVPASLEPGAIPAGAAIKKGKRYYFTGIAILVVAMVLIIANQFVGYVAWAMVSLSVAGMAAFLVAGAMFTMGVIKQVRAAAVDPLDVAKRFLGVPVVGCLIGLMILLLESEGAFLGFLGSAAACCVAALVMALAWMSLTENGTGTWVLDVGILLELVAVILLIFTIHSFLLWILDLAAK